MDRTLFAQLTGFRAVVVKGSFVRAASALGVSPSALSQTIRSLEARLNVRLVNRTTRSVSLTDAGATLSTSLGPALDQLEAAVEAINAFRERPMGRVRINAPRIVVLKVLGPLVAGFLDAHPEVELELIADDGLVDIVAARFDAGVRLGEAVARDMVSVPLGAEVRFVPVGSPAYFARFAPPETPEDLARHRCIAARGNTTGACLRWEFEKNGRALDVEPKGPLVLNDFDLALRAAEDGVGLALLSTAQTRDAVDAGRLRTALEDWCPPLPGLHFYLPGRRHQPAALRAFIAYARERYDGAGVSPGVRARPTPKARAS